MRELTQQDCLHVSGGIDAKLGISVAAGIVGGMLVSKGVSYFDVISTAAGIVVAAIAAGSMGTLMLPGPGTIVGASMGAITAYFCSAALVNVSLSSAAAIGVGYFTYSNVSTLTF